MTAGALTETADEETAAYVEELESRAEDIEEEPNGETLAAELTRFLRETDADAVLCAGRYTLLDRSALDTLLPEAAARGRSVVVGGVFNSGLLADPRPGATYDYAAAPAPLLDRALRMRAVAEAHGVPLRAAALHYPLRHPAVRTVVVGSARATSVRENLGRAATNVPEPVWAALRDEGLIP